MTKINTRPLVLDPSTTLSGVNVLSDTDRLCLVGGDGTKDKYHVFLVNQFGTTKYLSAQFKWVATDKGVSQAESAVTDYSFTIPDNLLKPALSGSNIPENIKRGYLLAEIWSMRVALLPATNTSDNYQFYSLLTRVRKSAKTTVDASTPPPLHIMADIRLRAMGHTADIHSPGNSFYTQNVGDNLIDFSSSSALRRYDLQESLLFGNAAGVANETMTIHLIPNFIVLVSTTGADISADEIARVRQQVCGMLTAEPTP